MRILVVSCLLGCCCLAIVGAGQDASRMRDAEWPTYGSDLASTHYSTLKQIDRTNFSTLEVAWRFKTDALGPRPEYNLQATPLVVGGVLYSTGGTGRAVFALDAATGELRWTYTLDEGPRGAAAPRQLSGRGLTYWADGDDARVIYVTPGYQLVALDARTGRPVSGFGRDGIVDLKENNDQVMDPVTGDIGLHAAPIVANDVIVVGAAHTGGVVPKSMRNEKGFIRGFDVRSGKRLWIFHTIPSPGEFGNETWENDSWSYTGNTGAWAQMSADEELGYVYVPTEMPTNDGYGGHRPGANLFGDTLLALDVKTGRRIWHFQAVHHDLWDFDFPCAPILADVVVDGRRVKVVAQPSKQGWVYVFDRVTGEPIWPIVERPVPRGDVPGEWYSPTQPFPTKPPAFEPQGLTEDQLIDFTPELRREAIQAVSNYRVGPIFTPPVVSQRPRPLGLLMLPNATGGANWQGGSLDPETGFLYIFSNTMTYFMGLVHDPEKSDMDFIQGIAPPEPGAPDQSRAGNPTVQDLPIVKPPWGRITAIDLNKGDIVWQIAHGETPDYVRDHPALAGLAIPRTGQPGRIGTLVTPSLVIAGDGGLTTSASGEMSAGLRAYDKATGQEVGVVPMPAPQTGTPMTYSVEGQQIIVVAVSGRRYSGELLAFRLPKGSAQ